MDSFRQQLIDETSHIVACDEIITTSHHYNSIIQFCSVWHVKCFVKVT